MMRLIYALGLLALISCGGSAPHAPAGINYDATCPCLPKRGVTSGLAYMPDLVWPRSDVAICFENGTDTQKEWVKDAVTRTWGATSRIEFTGWKACVGTAASQQDVHVFFSDHFEIHGIGVQLNHYTHGVTIGSLNGTELDLRTQAVFGFGFVMGFTAEQDRGDAPCVSINRFPGQSQKILGAWDDRSVMNECRPGYNGGLLSEGDIAGAQLVYGEPTSCGC